MKKIIHFITICLVCICCLPTKYISSPQNSNTEAIIENEKLNIVYRGIKNNIKIFVPNSDSINVSGIGVYKEAENKYYIIPTLGTSLEIKITNFLKGKETIEKKEFRILNIEKPYASIGKKIENITLSKEELATSKIEYFIPQFIIKLGKVGKFRYQINNEEPAINYGEYFNSSVKNKICSMKSCDYMIIDDLSYNPELQNIDLKKVTKLIVYIK